MLILCFVQAGYLAYVWVTAEPEHISSAIDKAVSDLSDPVEKERQRLRLAISQFVMRYQKPPTELEQLVPDYLTEVPRNPKTGDEFILVEKGMNVQVALNMQEAQAIKAKFPGSAIRGEVSEDELIDIAAIRTNFSYNPTGKRDPFLPYGADVADQKGDCDTPIECTALVKLKLALVIDTGAEKKAMVETPDGRGYTVKIGSKIGNAGGEIVDIKPDRLIVLEEGEDLAGNRHERTYELRLRQKGNDVNDDTAPAKKQKKP